MLNLIALLLFTPKDHNSVGMVLMSGVEIVAETAIIYFALRLLGVL